MPEHYGILSLLPPIVAIVLAISTKQVYVSLIFGLFLGWLVVESGHILFAAEKTIISLVQVFQDAGNTKTIMFSALIGAIILYIQKSGGVNGFANQLHKILNNKQGKSSSIRVQILCFLTGVFIFVESSISVLTAGTLFRPIFDKMKISREKLAYIIDSSSAPVCILLPFNGWGALIISLLAAQSVDRPFQTLIQSAVYNFYPLLALILVFFVITRKLDFGLMAKAEQRTKEGSYLWPNATPMVSDEISNVEAKSGVKARAINMFIPILTIIFFMPIFLAYTGWSSIDVTNNSLLANLLAAIANGSGSSAVLYSVVVSIIVCILLYSSQRIFTITEHTKIITQGISGLMPIALLLLFAFALGNICKLLGTGIFVADITRSWLSPAFVPALLFLISGFVAFSTGTSWGTFAIMIPIALPMADQLEVNQLIVIGAALGGGIFGDHCSPISDTTILSSMAAATDHIDHVRTQLPYALLAGTIALISYVIFGLVQTT